MPRFINNYQIKLSNKPQNESLSQKAYHIRAHYNRYVFLWPKKGVISSPSASWGTHILAPSFSSKGGMFDIADGVEEEEPDLEP